MEQKEEKAIEKSCQNCNYFKRFYYKSGVRFRGAIHGYCSNWRVKQPRGKNAQPLTVCGQWEEITVDKEELKEYLRDSLTLAADKLNEISYFIFDEKDDVPVDPTEEH